MNNKTKKKMPGSFSTPNQPRPTAAEATDEDDEEALDFYHHTQSPGYRG